MILGHMCLLNRSLNAQRKMKRRKKGHPPKMSMIAIFLEKSNFALICALIFIFIFLKNGTKNG